VHALNKAFGLFPIHIRFTLSRGTVVLDILSHAHGLVGDVGIGKISVGSTRVGIIGHATTVDIRSQMLTAREETSSSENNIAKRGVIGLVQGDNG